MITRVIINHRQWGKRIIRKDLRFLDGVNILVGSNGCGKSSLWQAMSDEIARVVVRSGEIEQEAQSREGIFIRLEGQKISLRTEEFEIMPWRHDRFSDKPVEFNFQIWGSIHSHGEGNLKRIEVMAKVPALNSGVLKCVDYLDEPENGLDHAAVMKAREVFAGFAAKGHQLIVATHHPLFWKMPGANIVVMDKDDDYVEKVLAQYREIL